MFRAYGIALVLLAAQPDTCSRVGPPVDPCLAEPMSHLVAYVEGESGPTSRRHESGAAFRAARPLDDGFVRLTFGLSNGDSMAVRVRSPITEWPLAVAGLYDVTVEFVGGSPSLSGFVISDATGPIVAGASDQRPGGRIFPEGGPLPGLVLALSRSSCGSRPHGNCFESIVNQRLRVNRGDEPLDLVHGESADVGGFRLTCLAAQEAKYAPRCADAGLVAFSWVAVRSGAP